jgi:hypothetical protein
MEVDMSLQSGFGDVVPNSFGYLMDSTTFHLTGARHANGTDYWAITHYRRGDTFFAFQVTSGGVITTPVVSHAGPAFVDSIAGDPLYEGHAQGTTVVNMAGDQLVVAAGSPLNYTTPGPPAYFDLYNFDASTGSITHGVTFPLPAGAICDGAEFSPDGKRLYAFISEHVGQQDDSSHYELVQYDLGQGSETAIVASRSLVWDTLVYLTSHGPVHNLGMAPDGKIYVVPEKVELKWFGVIEHPNSDATSCGYQRHAIQVTSSAAMGIPPFCKRYHDSEPEWLGVGHLHSDVPRVRIAPNPLEDQAALLWGDRTGRITLGWYDGLGRHVRTEIVAMWQGRAVIRRGALASGLYLLELMDEDHMVAHSRVIVP